MIKILIKTIQQSLLPNESKQLPTAETLNLSVDFLLEPQYLEGQCKVPNSEISYQSMH